MRLTSYWPWICTLPRLTGRDLLGAVIELSHWFVSSMKAGTGTGLVTTVMILVISPQ